MAGDNLKPPTAVVLCGGLGTRIASLYPDVPKPMIPVCGEPFLYWVTTWLVKQGIQDVIYSSGHMAEQVQAWSNQVSNRFSASLRCRAETVRLGTGGGIINCLDLCDDELLVVNGDSLAPVSLKKMFERMASGNVGGVLLGQDMPDTSRYGTLIVDDDDTLVEFSEKRPGAGTINLGVYLLSRDSLERFPRNRPISMELEILPGLIASGTRLAVERANCGSFIDIGTPQSVKQAENFVAQFAAGLSFFT